MLSCQFLFLKHNCLPHIHALRNILAVGGNKFQIRVGSYPAEFFQVLGAGTGSAECGIQHEYPVIDFFAIGGDEYFVIRHAPAPPTVVCPIESQSSGNDIDSNSARTGNLSLTPRIWGSQKTDFLQAHICNSYGSYCCS